MFSMENENNDNGDVHDDSDKEDSNEDSNLENSAFSDVSESSELDCSGPEKDKDFDVILSDLKQQFYILLHLYKSEKNIETHSKVEKIREGTAPEYQLPFKELKKNKEIRIHIAGMIQKYRLTNLQQFFEAEKLAAEQNYKNEQELLRDSIKKDIEEKIRKLNEERYKADSEFFSETHYIKKSRKYSYSDDYNPDRRRKTVTISGPFIVHRLKDEEILEDVNFIKCCLRSQKNNYMNHY